MRHVAGLLVTLATLAAAGDAHATAGTAFGETSRPAAMANAVSAMPGSLGTMLLNPAGLADLQGPAVLFTGHADRLDQWFARSGEPHQDMSRWFGGFGFAAATPLPGPAWLRRFRVGFAMDVPAEHVLQVTVQERLDTPTSPLYSSRPDRLSTIGTLAVQLFDRLQLGAGLAVTPSLDTPTVVTYDASRDKDISRDVVVRLDRNLTFEASPFFGVRGRPLQKLSLAVVYRDRSISRASGSQRTVAGGILADDPIDFLAFWDPAELVFGAAVGPLAGLTVSTDVTVHRWSDFRDGFGRPLDQPFGDTVSVRQGLEWRCRRHIFALRAGWAVEPSPIPEQVGGTNYLGGSSLVLGLGGGVDFRPLLHWPVAIDAHVRTRLGGLQSAMKDPGKIADADPNTPGQQITNLGYPGFASRANLYQAGLTLTVFVGKDAR